MSSSTELRVLIVGAGITGLLIAQGLKKAGITYTIFDAESPAFSRLREWSLALHWSLPTLEKVLPPELFAQLSDAQCDPAHDRGVDETIDLRNSETGQLLKSISVPGMKRLSRRKLRYLCTEGINVLWGKTLVDITYSEAGDSVTAHFADGSSYSGAILLGADGPKSKVRELLLGEEKARTRSVGIVYNTAIVKYGDAEKALHVRSGHPVNCLGYHPGGKFHMISIQDIPDPEHPESWSFLLGSSWLGQPDTSLSNEERLATMKRSGQDLAEPFYSACMWIPEETEAFTDNMAYWVPVPWDNSNGRVTLAGDAAHPLPPHRGQGLNHSILDASNLIDTIVKIQTGPGVRETDMIAYEKEMLERGAEEVQLSVKTALTVHDWTRFMESPLMKHGVTKIS